jgi:GntR family transcriptional regulator
MEFRIDYTSGIPIYRQIIEQVRYGVARGELVTGERLPTVRQLAVDLSINPNTVARAYRELEFEGVLDTQQGSGTFVGRRVPEIDPIERQRRLDRILAELLTQAATYGFTLEELQTALRIRQEASS